MLAKGIVVQCELRRYTEHGEQQVMMKPVECIVGVLGFFSTQDGYSETHCDVDHLLCTVLTFQFFIIQYLELSLVFCTVCGVCS